MVWGRELNRPSIMAGFAENGGLFPYMVEAVRKALFSAEPLGEYEEALSLKT
jgi:hypothetical protein